MPAETGVQNRVTIDPITRLEGHGKIDIFLGEDGAVKRAYFQVPELRGFEKFAEGRPVEDMPQITSRICGVCPMAHHMAATKAVDHVFGVEPPPAAHKIREMVYSAFMVEDHSLHFYFLGGPDFVAGPQAPPAERNVLGVIGRLGAETGRKVIAMRRKLRGLITLAAGKVGHPVFGLPGGVARRITKEEQLQFQQGAAEAVEFAQFTLDLFDKLVLKNSDYLNLILSDHYTHRTHYMGMVDDRNRVNFYRGQLRVVSPEGQEVARFDPRKYADYIAERVEPWSYMKFCYLKQPGWKGFTEGAESGVYSVAPLARLNAAEGMATPLAQAAFEHYKKTLGAKIVHQTLANHWARLIELLYAAERMKELAADPEITSDRIRMLPTGVPKEGVGVVEAPRGTLFHHYATDERGVVRKANLIVATQNNAARIAMSVEKAAKGLVTRENMSEGLLNMVEMAFRAYDPCLGCATHALPGDMPLRIRVRELSGGTLYTVQRDSGGRIQVLR
ncbi:MAG: Ni/Fe hydrogenase subunit alpha [Bryobacteraceae bacterium]|nr:Ni/Fe hydrogenase subunit alpha [Bryobacteraceae bacterium]